MFTTTKRHEAALAAKDALIAEKDRTIADVAKDRDHWHERYGNLLAANTTLSHHAGDLATEIDRLRTILAVAYVRGAKGRIVKYVEAGK